MKRKAIPQWIREALEKREKDKQKQLAKQQEEESAPVVEQQDVEVDKKDEVKEEPEEKKPFFKIKKVGTNIILIGCQCSRIFVLYFTLFVAR